MQQLRMEGNGDKMAIMILKRHQQQSFRTVIVYDCSCCAGLYAIDTRLMLSTHISLPFLYHNHTDSPCDMWLIHFDICFPARICSLLCYRRYTHAIWVVYHRHTFCCADWCPVQWWPTHDWYLYTVAHAQSSTTVAILHHLMGTIRVAIIVNSRLLTCCFNYKHLNQQVNYEHLNKTTLA